MTERQTLTVRLHPNDNVVTARIDLLPNTAVAGEHVACAVRIPAGHKIATRPIAKRASRCASTTRSSVSRAQDIAPGEHVHVHNVEMRDFDRDYAFGADVRPTRCVPEGERVSFEGLPGGRTARPARATSSACSRP